MTNWLLEFNWHFILHSFNIDRELSSQQPPREASWGAAKHWDLFMALRQPSLKVALITLKGLCGFLFSENFNHSLNFLKVPRSAARWPGAGLFWRRSPLVHPMAAPHLFYGTKNLNKDQQNLNRVETKVTIPPPPPPHTHLCYNCSLPSLYKRGKKNRKISLSVGKKMFPARFFFNVQLPVTHFAHTIKNVHLL